MAANNRKRKFNDNVPEKSYEQSFNTKNYNDNKMNKEEFDQFHGLTSISEKHKQDYFYSPVHLKLLDILDNANNNPDKYNDLIEEYENMKQYYKTNKYELSTDELDIYDTECDYLLFLITQDEFDIAQINRFLQTINYYKITDDLLNNKLRKLINISHS